ncbi:Ribosomal protein L25 (general stress protein Ctc) [Paenibacillus uliginis N3/975]|uniref:Ribosomal protein L25 (General stress protein Ctc) n=1 Tax=Paenibacillus uliginis N3/975 TaxID=1313296 RepID=A0A1X7HDF0_9BACL|nr:50S ribosomal protein L25 [Paenibacillus uliginis]SMF83474.1 Ribosomal protein L25 (general stress protein Ctc) [Paenibacillus uliginis N3/975]
MTHHLEALTRMNEKRSDLRNLRKEGRLPCNLLGKKGTIGMVHVNAREFSLLMRDGLTKTLELSIDGGTSVSVELKEIQRNPVTKDIIHVDMLIAGGTAAAGA